MFKMNSPYFSLSPLISVLPLGITKKILVPFLLCFSIMYLYKGKRSPWAFCSSGWTALYEMLQSLHHLCSASVDWYVHISLVLRSSDLDPVFQVRPHQGWAEEKGHCPWLAGIISPDASQDTDSHLCNNGTLLSHIQLRVNQNRQVLLHKAVLQLDRFQHILVPGFVPPQVHDLAFVCLADDLAQECRTVPVTTAYEIQLKLKEGRKLVFFSCFHHHTHWWSVFDRDGSCKLPYVLTSEHFLR